MTDYESSDHEYNLYKNGSFDSCASAHSLAVHLSLQNNTLSELRTKKTGSRVLREAFFVLCEIPMFSWSGAGWDFPRNFLELFRERLPNQAAEGLEVIAVLNCEV